MIAVIEKLWLRTLRIIRCPQKIYFFFINIMHYPVIKRNADDPFYEVFREFISLCKQKPSPSILEIGSRNVSGISRRDLFLFCDDYVGFDILPGEGVDIVGDAHALSASVPSEHFDCVYSVSVFEHLLFPWKAVLEINQVMKLGGYVFVSTHPVWPEHELPWDFWRFPRNGFHALFNQYTGFEIVSLAEGLPCNIYSLVDDLSTKGVCFGKSNQGVAVIAKKIGGYRRDLLRWDIEISDVLNTMYPNKNLE